MLSTNLRKYRTEKHLSTIKLGQLAGVSDRIIAFIESGKSKNPQINTLTSLANALDVTIEDLIK